MDRNESRAGAAPRTTEFDTDPAFRDACGTQSYPRLVLAGVRLRVGWTVLAVALACELPQYLLLGSFYADDGWSVPARRETDGLGLAAVYASVTALLAWLSRRYSHRKNEMVPTAACVAICAATWAPLPGPDWAAGGGFVYAIASMVLAWSTLRTQARSRHYPDEYFEPAAHEAFLRLQPRSGIRARFAFRGRTVAGARAPEVVIASIAVTWGLGLASYGVWHISRPKPSGFAEALTEFQRILESGDKHALAALGDAGMRNFKRKLWEVEELPAEVRIESFSHDHLRGRPKPQVSVHHRLDRGTLDVILRRSSDGVWRWTSIEYWP